MTDSKPVAMGPTNGLMDKSKELQKEILMEKLRSKTSQYKNLSETSKAVRMALLVRNDCNTTSFANLNYILKLLKNGLYLFRTSVGQ